MQLIFGVLVVAWFAFSIGFAANVVESNSFTQLGTLAPVLVVAASILVWTRRNTLWPWLRARLDAHTAAMDGIPLHQLGWWIAIAAGVGLFAELAMIRLHSSYFQLFAYFKNVSLLSCFLGLGIGYTLGGRRLSTPLFLPAIALQVFYMHMLHLSDNAGVLQHPVSEELAMGATFEGLGALPPIYGFLVFVFGINALTFIPMGQLASRLMSRTNTLVAYGWNIAGSIAGIVGFYFLSYLWAPPVVWLAAVAIFVVVFLRSTPTLLAASAGIMIGVVAILGIPPRAYEREIHSPYQILTLQMFPDQTPVLLSSHVYYQRTLKLDSAAFASAGTLRSAALHYMLPYRIRPNAQRALIVGAGMGNDVAAALRAGVDTVDAVEIDPAIQSLGRVFHPEDPYGDDRVNAIINDARAFIRHTDNRYDLIVYGLLDSHSLLSGNSGVRLDSYVYTVEALREARSKLREGGLINLTFSLLRPELAHKFLTMIEEAFDGQRPLIFETGYNLGYAFVIGEPETMRAVAPPPGTTDLSLQIANSGFETDMSTDNWPFIYMPVRKYPFSYAIMLLVLLGVSLLFIGKLTPGFGQGTSWPCFFLGTGFMLVETKGITELALVYGSTWVVVGVVIAAILVMAFAANLIVIRFGAPPRATTYGLLLAALVTGMFITSDRLAALSPTAAGLVLTGVLTLPLFFSGFAFSTELKRGVSVASALSSNLLGAMLGGFLEYNSMYFGFRSLYFVAFAAYALAFITSRSGPPTTEQVIQTERRAVSPTTANV